MRPPSPCCDSKEYRKGPWTPDEDAKILAHVSKYGTGNWISVPKRAGLRRCGKSCRLRWTNYLRPNLKHDSFTPQEEDLIIKLHAAIGSRWSIIAQQLPGRTDNDVKNYWNTKLRKKLKEMGIDPVTHRPFSQILRDYGNMGSAAFSTRIKPINRDMKGTSSSSYPLKPEPSLLLQPELHPNFNTQQMISAPTTPRPVQDFLAKTNSNSISNSNNTYADQSLNLLSQLQAIKMVTETSLCSQYEPGCPLGCSLSSSLSSSPSSSSSCSSSACSTAVQDNKSSSQNFSWSDFLLEDANLLTTDPQVPQKTPEFPFQDISSQVQNVTLQGELKTKAGQEHKVVEELQYSKTGCVLKEPSPSSSSFVETMINRDKEMVMEFPEIWEETLYY